MRKLSLLSCMIMAATSLPLIAASNNDIIVRIMLAAPKSPVTPPVTPPVEPPVTPPVEPPVDPETDPNPNSWIEFFHSKNTLGQSSSMSEWFGKTDSASVSGLSLTSSMLPKGTFGVQKISKLYMDNNSLSNINFMKGVNHVGELKLDNNTTLNDINGLSDVTSAGNLFIKNTGITNVNGLSNLTTAYTVNLVGNKKLTDFSGLKNLNTKITGVKISVNIDQENYYQKKRLNWDTPFCQAAERGDLIVWLNYNGSPTSIQVGQFCYSDDPWLEFLHGSGKSLTIQNVVKLETSPNGVIDLRGSQWSDGNFPQTPINITKFLSLDLRDNNLTHVNFLSNVINGGHLYLAGNKSFNNLTGLSRAVSMGGMIMDDVPLTTLNGMQNITSMTSLSNKNNNKLLDISALANLTTVTQNLWFNHASFTKAPPLSSPFCQSWIAGKIKMYQGSSGTVVAPTSVCK